MLFQLFEFAFCTLQDLVIFAESWLARVAVFSAAFISTAAGRITLAPSTSIHGAKPIVIFQG
jgi:hypothetical protein